MFFTVEEGEEPVAELTAEDFAIYEDEKLVSTFEGESGRARGDGRAKRGFSFGKPASPGSGE